MHYPDNAIPIGCDFGGCESNLPRCPVCRYMFVREIDVVCPQCKETTECMMCGTTGHNHLFEHTEVDGFLCRECYLNLYGETPTPFKYGTQHIHTHEYKERLVSCMNINCNNKLSAVEAHVSPFCGDCDKEIRAGICTSCHRKIPAGGTADMYGHCEDCTRNIPNDTFLCQGCHTVTEADQVGKSLRYCPKCEEKILQGICTLCGEYTEKVDEHGWCLQCSPDPQYECEACDNHVTQNRTYCARCMVGGS